MPRRATIPATSGKHIFRAFTLAFETDVETGSKSTMNPAFSRVIILCVATGKTSRDFICESGAWIERGGSGEVCERENRKNRRHAGCGGKSGIYGKS